MTEQEMNLKVAEIVGIDAAHFSMYTGPQVYDTDSLSRLDWCNLPSNWGELVDDACIDIAHQENGMVFAGSGKCGDDFYAHEATDKKIGVAVVKVFLMMNGVKL